MILRVPHIVIHAHWSSARNFPHATQTLVSLRAQIQKKQTIIISQPNRNKTITYDFFFNRTYNQIETKIFKSFVTIILCRGYLIVGKNKIN